MTERVNIGKAVPELYKAVAAADQLAEQSALAAGTLIEVLPEHRLASPLSYWLLQGPRSHERAEVQAFCQWLLSEASKTHHAMMPTT